MQFKVILASVKSDITDKVVDAAKATGATGATIIHARGTGIREAKTFFSNFMKKNIWLESSWDVECKNITFFS